MDLCDYAFSLILNSYANGILIFREKKENIDDIGKKKMLVAAAR